MFLLVCLFSGIYQQSENLVSPLVRQVCLTFTECKFVHPRFAADTFVPINDWPLYSTGDGPLGQRGARCADPKAPRRAPAVPDPHVPHGRPSHCHARPGGRVLLQVYPADQGLRDAGHRGALVVLLDISYHRGAFFF